jgi:hypothetical protein
MQSEGFAGPRFKEHHLDAALAGVSQYQRRHFALPERDAKIGLSVDQHPQVASFQTLMPQPSRDSIEYCHGDVPHLGPLPSQALRAAFPSTDHDAESKCGVEYIKLFANKGPLAGRAHYRGDRIFPYAAGKGVGSAQISRAAYEHAQFTAPHKPDVTSGLVGGQSFV